jgi:glycosyltransferase
MISEFPHVSACISEKDDGIYYAMNKGIELASGDVIGILNADDIYANNDVLKEVMDLFEDASIDAVYGDLDFVDPYDLTKTKRSWRSGTFNKHLFYQGWMPPHPTFFVRSDAYRKYGKFNTTLTSAADYELMLRFLLKNEIKPAYLKKVMVKMRLGGKSTGSIINRLIANREDRLAWQLNGLKPHFFTLILKPLRKINQFISNG